jgi:cell division transport system permease protein
MAPKVGYFIRQAATNLRRNKLMTVAAASTTAVTLLLFGGVLTVGDFVRSIAGELEDQIAVDVYLVDEITQEDQDEIQAELESLAVVSNVAYISKEEAFDIFRERHRDQEDIWMNVDAEVLPASFEVRMADPERVDVIRSRFETNPNVDEVVDSSEIVERLVSFTSLLRNVSAVMVLVLLGAAVLLIANTTQLAIYARRREIEIMKLVGATNWFVRLPFMIEGIVTGLIGAAAALVLLTGAKAVAAGAMPIFMPTTALEGLPWQQVFWLSALGVLVGVLGSALAMRRFLDV